MIAAFRKTVRLGLIAVIIAALPSCGLRPNNLIEGERIPGVLALKMFDEDIGWACDGASILKTSDGGRTWAPAGPSGGFYIYPEAVDAAFLDADHAWMIIHVPGPDASPDDPDPVISVYRTSDGGASWASTDIDEQAVAGRFSFSDSDNGWLTLYQGFEMSQEKITVFRTSDGGASWTYVCDTSEEPGKIPFTGNKSGPTFATKERGFLTGYWPTPGVPYLFTSHDGGTSWSQTDLPLPEGHEESNCYTYPPVFFSADSGILPVSLSGDKQEIVFYSTADGGATWIPGAPLVVDTEDRPSWDLPGDGIIVASAGGQFHVSTDAGVTWTSVSPNTNISLSGRPLLSFIDEKTGWALASGKLLKTVDGGRTWRRT